MPFAVTQRLLGYVSGGLAIALAVIGAFAWLQTARLADSRELVQSLNDKVVLLSERIKSDQGLIAVRDRLIASQNRAVLAMQQAAEADRKVYLARISAAEKLAQAHKSRAADIMSRQASTEDELERSREALKLIQEMVGDPGKEAP